MKKQDNRWFFALMLLPVQMFMHGFVLTKLWGMFLVSTFGFAELSIVQAAGVILVLDFIFSKIDWKDTMEKVPLDQFMTKLITHAIFTPLVFWFTGYVLNLFM